MSRPCACQLNVRTCEPPRARRLLRRRDLVRELQPPAVPAASRLATAPPLKRPRPTDSELADPLGASSHRDRVRTAGADLRNAYARDRPQTRFRFETRLPKHWFARPAWRGHEGAPAPPRSRAPSAEASLARRRSVVVAPGGPPFLTA